MLQFARLFKTRVGFHYDAYLENTVASEEAQEIFLKDFFSRRYKQQQIRLSIRFVRDVKDGSMYVLEIFVRHNIITCCSEFFLQFFLNFVV
jgi:hypothetical protein